MQKLITVTEGAYGCPFLVKQSLRNASMQARGQEIVYRSRGFTYAESGSRVSRLASAQRDRLGVRPGDIVGIMGWDSNRFPAALFAVPERFVFAAGLPKAPAYKTGVGKLDKKQWRLAYGVAAPT